MPTLTDRNQTSPKMMRDTIGAPSTRQRMRYSQHADAGNGASSRDSDFVQFLHSLLDFVFTPITFPLRVIRNVLTSPLTISLVLKLILVIILVVASAAFSVLAVGAFWWSWGTGGAVEVEGWLIYGSRAHRTPHALVQLPLEKFQDDLAYDVQIELELVRPSYGAEEMGNFMVTLELRSLRTPETAVVRSAQPSLPPPPLPSTFLSFPSFPTYLIPPCVIPWPFRSLCPSRILGYAGTPDAKIKERRRRGSIVSPAKGKDVVLLTKELIEDAMIKPGRGDLAIGSAFVSIGREDTFPDHDAGAGRAHREVRTTGWVVVRFIPRPTGVRWLLTSHPIPPLIILPPLSLTLALSSALLGFLIISCIGGRTRSQVLNEDSSKDIDDVPEHDHDFAHGHARDLELSRARVESERRRDEMRAALALERQEREWEEEAVSTVRERESTLRPTMDVFGTPTLVVTPEEQSDVGDAYSESGVTDDTPTDSGTAAGTIEGSVSTESWENEEWENAE